MKITPLSSKPFILPLLTSFLITLPLIYSKDAHARSPQVFERNETFASSRYSEIQRFLNLTATQNPLTTRVIEVGESDNGEKIQGLAIGSGSIKNLVIATHHGNEYGSTEVAKAFAQSLATQPIEGQTLYVIPVLNISGYNRFQRTEQANGRSFDPNRDYPGPCGTDGPHRLKSTRALARFIDQNNITVSATLHTFSPAVVYPWGFATADLVTPSEDIFKSLVQIATQWSHYEVGNSTAVIYPAAGTFEDYAYWKHGIWSLLFELGESHSPNSQDVQEMISKNVPGLRALFTQAPTARAELHDFNGKCDDSLLALDRREE
jgi:carboxypeptidase T